MSTFPDTPKICISENTQQKRRTYVYWEEWNGERFLHIRMWFLGKSGEYEPSRKGIAIPSDKVKPLFEALIKVSNE